MTYFYGKGGLRGPPSFYERQTMKPKITMFLCGVLVAVLIVSVSLLTAYFWKSKQQTNLYSALATARGVNDLGLFQKARNGIALATPWQARHLVHQTTTC